MHVSGVDTYRLMANSHQFVLTGDMEELAELHLPDDDALVCGEPGQLVVRTGAYAAPVEVEVELLGSEPGQPEPDWEDVVELSLRCGDRILVAELMEAPKAAIVREPGWYRLRVCARGRDAGEERGEVGARAKIIEHYLIQAWPAPAAAATTVRARSLQPVDHTAGRTYLAAARAAAGRINADLGHAPGYRVLSGDTGTVHVEWTYSATRRRLFLYMALLNCWTSASSAGDRTVEAGAGYRLSHNQYRDIWDGIPTGHTGWVEATLVQVDRPKSVVTRWEWRSGPNYGAGTPILAGPTTLTVRLDETTAQDGRPRTTVHLEHHGLPTEWLDDMRACWLCKLEAGDDVYPLAVRTRRG